LGEAEFPEISTKLFGSPPLQVTVTPCDRLTELIAFMLVQLIGLE
jgi:hypothetical protein